MYTQCDQNFSTAFKIFSSFHLKLTALDHNVSVSIARDFEMETNFGVGGAAGETNFVVIIGPNCVLHEEHVCGTLGRWRPRLVNRECFPDRLRLYVKRLKSRTACIILFESKANTVATDDKRLLLTTRA